MYMHIHRHRYIYIYIAVDMYTYRLFIIYPNNTCIYMCNIFTHFFFNVAVNTSLFSHGQTQQKEQVQVQIQTKHATVKIYKGAGPGGEERTSSSFLDLIFSGLTSVHSGTDVLGACVFIYMYMCTYIYMYIYMYI